MDMLGCIIGGGDLLDCTWGMLPWWFKLGSWICLALLLGGAVWNLAQMAKSIAGWPGFAAVIGFAVMIAALFTLRRRPKPSDLFTGGDVDGADAAPSPASRVKRPKGLAAPSLSGDH